MKPLPKVDQYNYEYFEGAKQDKLVIQYCTHCEEYIFYPRQICNKCLNDSLIWKNTTGEGEVHSFAIIYRPQHDSLFEDVPIILVAVKLKEGPILISNIVDCEVSEVEIGMKLKVKGYQIEDEVDISVPVFQPVT